MTALATIQPAPVAIAIPEETTFDAWLDLGRDLATNRRQTDWMIGDWLAHGQTHFADQIEMEFLADRMGIAPKRLKAVAQVAQAFPAHARDDTLSVDHHAHVAGLPQADALEILRTAHDMHWTPEETRIAAVKRKAIVEQPKLLRDDPEYDELMAIVRAWNRASRDVRQQFADLMTESHLSMIEA